KVKLTIFDRLRDAGISAGYYAGVEPQSYVFASHKYDKITYPNSEFFTAARAGKLPHVTFLDPDLDSIAETTGLTDDDDAFGDVRRGEAFIARVYEALANSPHWDRLVLVITFDEHGGFYDHVPPPRVRDDTVLPNGMAGPDFTRLGFRVPLILG